jgi:VWFA-related protein
MALFLLRCLLPVLLVTSSVAELTFLRVDKAIVEQRLKKLPKTPIDRLHMLRAEFVKAGCPQVREQHFVGEQLPNVLCTVPGKAKGGTILVSVPIEYKNEGDDAVVGWAGLLTLPMLAEAINSTQHQSTYVLAAFAGNDRGVSGVKWYLQQLTPVERQKLRGVVALSKIGRGPVKYALPWAEKRKSLETVYGQPVTFKPLQERDKSPITRMLEVAADALKFKEMPEEYDDIERNEAEIINEEKIPAITVHSMAFRTLPRVGGSTIQMQQTALDLDAYYDTYTLLSVYALLLDRALEPQSSKREVLVASAVTDDKPATATAPGQVASQGPTTPTQTPAPTAEASTSVAAVPPSPADVTEETVLQAVPGQAPNSPPTFRSSVQLVQVDVVVTDKDGRPVNDLRASDFTVLQDGVAREIRAFEPHSLLPVATAKPAEVKLPENTFTNLPDSDYDEARIILLFDMLNTPAQEQQFAQKQLMKVLQDLPAERRIAIFALSEKLTLVQGFTNDRQLLVEAAESIGAQRSHQYLGALQRQQTMGGARGLARATRAAVTIPAAGGVFAEPDPSMTGAPRENIIREEESFFTTARVQFTIDAFNGLARAVSGYPGRKSVLWISGGFPIAISPDLELETATRGAENFRDQWAQTGKLLATSRIAMYPIDVRGIQPRGVDITVSNMESSGLLEMRQAVSPRSGTGGTMEAGSSGLANVLNQQSKLYAHERSTMLHIAHDTGGRAFIGSNNIREALTRGVQDAATYYTVAYEPDKAPQSEMKYHNLEVKVARPDVKLTYRRGYYSLPQEAISPEVGVAALRGSLQPGMPPATSLYLTAKVTAPAQAGKPVRVDYIINPNGVTFSDAQNSTKHAVVDCMVIAYDQEGREVGHASDTLDATIPMNQYDWVLRRGLPANQEIVLKPGAYNLRLGVMDRTSQQIGTLDVPLIIPSS